MIYFPGRDQTRVQAQAVAFQQVDPMLPRRWHRSMLGIQSASGGNRPDSQRWSVTHDHGTGLLVFRVQETPTKFPPPKKLHSLVREMEVPTKATTTMVAAPLGRYTGMLPAGASVAIAATAPVTVTIAMKGPSGNDYPPEP
jgi:hypothetical protein